MQQSVLQKKIRSERARESENVKKIDTLCLALGIQWLHLIWVEKCVDFIWHSKGGSAQMKFEMASGCEWECEWLHVAKTAKHLHRTVERHADITSALLERSSSAKLLQDTWRKKKKKLDVCLGSPRTSANSDSERSWKTNKPQLDKKKRQMQKQRRSIMNWGDHEPLQSCGPPTREGATDSTRPSLNRPRYQTCVCVWMDPSNMNGWTQCRGARFISSNDTPPSPLPSRPSPPPPGKRRHPLPAAGSRESGKKCVSHVRESGWMSCVCLGACVTGSVWGWVRTRAETAGRNKKIKKKKLNIFTEKQNLRSAATTLPTMFQESKFLPLKEADPHFPEEEEEEEKKMNLKQTKLSLRNYFCFGLLLSLY